MKITHPEPYTDLWAATAAVLTAAGSWELSRGNLARASLDRRDIFQKDLEQASEILEAAYRNWAEEQRKALPEKPLTP